jgi:hypothetical protein
MYLHLLCNFLSIKKYAFNYFIEHSIHTFLMKIVLFENKLC